MVYLSRDDILKAEDLETRDIDVPEWGGTVRVRALSGTDRDAFEGSLVRVDPTSPDGAVPDMTNRRAKLVARAIVDEDNKSMFDELDVGALGQKSAAALERVFAVAAELSGLDQGDVEAAAGNSDAALGGDSASNSLETSSTAP